MDELTPRELEVLRLLAQGASNTCICRLLVISPKTVETHTRHIYWKLGLVEDAGTDRRVAAALHYWSRHGDGYRVASAA